MKNYVKVHKGRKVPEGAVYYGDGNQCFYNANKSEFHSSVYSKWKPISCTVTARMAVELPETPQEWNGEGLPPVGAELVINFEEYSEGLTKLETELDGEAVFFLGHVVNKHGYIVFTVEDIDGNCYCYGDDCFRPLKTQQEKDREAFIEKSMNLIESMYSSIEAQNIAVDLAGRQFDAGFTAPKAGDNE